MRALVTGGSSGIGYELARILVGEGHDVIIVAKDKDKLRRAAQRLGKKATTMTADLSAPGAARKVYARHKGKIDVLVNNAGFGRTGTFTEGDLKTDEDMIGVNITALTALSKLFLQDFKRKGRGKIMNVSSTASLLPGPGMAVYYATKAYVTSLSKALSHELEGTGVTCTALLPGVTRTGFFRRAGMRPNRMLGGAMSARRVASEGYRGMMSGKRVVLPGLRNKLTACAAAIIPDRLAMAAISRMHKKKK